jgi:hypothetical protein
MRSLLSIASLILLAGCSRSDTRQAGQPAPVGYAQASSAVAAAPPPAPAPVPETPSPAADASPQPDPEPVARPAAGGSFTIPRGTPLSVRLDETVDTRRNRPGDLVHATLSRPLVVGGQTVIPAGTRFAGHVTMADASGRLKGRAHIGVALDSFHLNGRQYRISTTSVERASAAHKKRNGILIGGGAGLGAALGAIAGGGKGALIGAGAGAAAGTAGAAATGKLNVAIPAETPLRFTLRSSVEV